MCGYRFIEHTADAGIEVWARSKEELFRFAALGMLDIIFERERVEKRLEKRLAVEGIDDEDLLVRWLSEIKYIVQQEGFLVADVVVEKLDGNRIESVLIGEPFSPERHSYLIELKNVTYHGLKISVDDNGIFRVRVIFDL